VAAESAPELSQGVTFFNSFRDLSVTEFWTAKMGMEDLQYIGNTLVPIWKKRPDEALAKLGVKRDGRGASQREGGSC
jgi:gluconate 2-dehydrogenase gamma chain